MLNRLIEALEERITRNINLKDYKDWQSHDCTQALMAALEKRWIEEAINIRIPNQDTAAREAVRIRTMQEHTEYILEWTPQELIENED